MPKTAYPLKLTQLIESCMRQVKTLPQRGFEEADCYFKAHFMQGRKLLSKIERGVLKSLKKLIETNYETENPQAIKVELFGKNDLLIWGKLFEIEEPVLPEAYPSLPKMQPQFPHLNYGLGNGSEFRGLGEAEINTLVDKRVSETLAQEEHQRLQTEFEKERLENQQLKERIVTLEDTLAAKSQTEYYANILAMVFPGLASLIGGPAGSVMSSLAGTAPEALIPPETTAPDHKTTQIKLMEEFLKAMPEAAVSQVYMVLLEIEKDPSKLTDILQFLLTKTTTKKS